MVDNCKCTLLPHNQSSPQPIISHKYSGEKVGMKTLSPLQDALASRLEVLVF